MKTFRDKNGFQVEPGEIWNDQMSDQTIKFMTKPKNNSSIDQRRAPLNKNPNTKVTPKNDFDVVSKTLLTAYTYDNTPGTEEHLRKHLIDKMNSGQQLDSDEVRFMMDTKPKPKYPNEATPQQMAELKKKIDKYKDIHFPKQKPFKQPKLKDRPVRKPTAVPPKTETFKMVNDPRFNRIEKEVNEIVKPEPFNLNKYIEEKSAEKLKLQQEAHDRQFGRGGLPELVRPV